MLTILLGFEITGIVFALMYRADLTLYAKQMFDEVMDTYGQANASRVTQNVDFIQFKVCVFFFKFNFFFEIQRLRTSYMRFAHLDLFVYSCNAVASTTTPTGSIRGGTNTHLTAMATCHSRAVPTTT